jgi:hypothetical protein
MKFFVDQRYKKVGKGGELVSKRRKSEDLFT